MQALFGQKLHVCFGQNCRILEEYDLKKQQKTAIITTDALNLITSYEEKPVEPKGHYAVPPFYFYKAEDILPNGILEFKVNAPEDELIRFNHRLLLKTEENHVYFAEGLKALITI